MRPRTVLSALLVMTFLVATPISSKFGVGKTRVRFAVYHPPAFHAHQHQLRLEVGSLDSGKGATVSPRIRQLLEEGLSRRGFTLAPNARTLLQLTLTDSTVGLAPVVRSELTNVHVGEHTETDKDGKTKQVEDCKQQTSLVTYLVSSGHLALDVKAKDTQSQSVLMSQLVERSYHHESAIAGPRRCNGASYTLPVNQLQQDPVAILSAMADEAVREVLTLATGYDEPREVLLAVDDVLKPGNAQAVAGDWQDAVGTWTNTSPRSKAVQAARHYNLGAAHEVLAALSTHSWELNDARLHLSKAQESYSAALKLDPKEKYFRDTMTRLEIERQLLQQQLQQASEDDPAPTAAARLTRAADPPPSTVPLEGWPAEPGTAHDYRVYVRTRLSAEKEQPTPALKQLLLSSAADYDLDSNAALATLDSEIQRNNLLRQNMETYRADFEAAASNGEITSEERQMLHKRQQILHLSDDQVKEIESRVKAQKPG